MTVKFLLNVACAGKAPPAHAGMTVKFLLNVACADCLSAQPTPGAWKIENKTLYICGGLLYNIRYGLWISIPKEGITL